MSDEKIKSGLFGAALFLGISLASCFAAGYFDSWAVSIWFAIQAVLTGGFGLCVLIGTLSAIHRSENGTPKREA